MFPSDKPHMRLKHQIWSCASLVGRLYRIGLGYTVMDAWRDWERQEYLCGPFGAAVWLGDMERPSRIPAEGEGK